MISTSEPKIITIIYDFLRNYFSFLKIRKTKVAIKKNYEEVTLERFDI